MIFKKYYIVTVAYYQGFSDFIKYMDIMCEGFPERSDLKDTVRKVDPVIRDFSILNITKLNKKQYEGLRITSC